VALQAAEMLAEQEEIEAEVIDPRTLRPLDIDTIVGSVRRTNRAVVVEEGWPTAGIGAQLVDDIQREAFDFLDAPVARVSGLDVPMHYQRALEKIIVPSAEAVVAAARHVCYLDD
jgi:pyruvate dehydrogenase E1 component beta subunit